MSKAILNTSSRKNSFLSNASDEQITSKSLQLKPQRRESRSPSINSYDRNGLGGYSATPKNPAKLSMGSSGGMDYYDTGDMDNQEDENSNFALKQTDGKTFVGSFQEGMPNKTRDNEMEELLNNRIFRELIDKDLYKNGSECIVCKAKFGLMKGRKNCHFCGEAVCDEHSKKRRPNPQNRNDYHRCCDVCDETYINKKIIEEYTQKLKQRDEELFKYDEKIREMQKKRGNTQKEYDKLMLNYSKNGKIYTETINQLTKDISRIKDEIKKAEKESQQTSNEYNEIHQRKQQIESEHSENKQEVEKLEKELMVLNNQVSAIIQDIGSLNKKLKEYEDAINRGKIKKGDDKTNTYVQGSYTEPSLSVSDADSFLPSKTNTSTRPSQAPKNHFESQSKYARKSNKGNSNQNENPEGEAQAGKCGCNVF